MYKCTICELNYTFYFSAALKNNSKLHCTSIGRDDDESESQSLAPLTITLARYVDEREVESMPLIRLEDIAMSKGQSLDEASHCFAFKMEIPTPDTRSQGSLKDRLGESSRTIFVSRLSNVRCHLIVTLSDAIVAFSSYWR